MALASTSATASAAVLKNPFLGARRSLANAASLGAAKPAACRVVVVAAAVGKKSWIPAVKSDAEFINPSWLDGSLPASCAEPTSQDTRDPSPIVPAPAATDLSQEGSPGMAVPGGEGEGRQRPVVLVTGCSEGGIGHSMARAFAAAGCAVVATARSRASMRGLEGDPRYLLLELDVRSDESARRAVGDALRELGRVDVLVNNAGIHLVAPLAEVPMESFHQVFDTNVYGAMRMIQAVIPHMMERREGTIVNVGSITALAPGPWAGVYSASKAALHALGDTLRVELKSFGINVMTVAPGGTKTNMGSKSADKYDQINDWKYYKKYDKSLRARTNITQGAGSVSAEDLAKRVVNLVLKKNPPAWFAYGQFTAILTILYYAPLWLRDYFYKLVMKC